MKRFGRLPLALVGLLALGLVALVAARGYLSSPAVTRQVAAALQARLGTPVSVGSAVVALAGDSEVYELTLGPADDPYLVVPRVRTDLTVWGALRGVGPGQVTLDGAHLTLRFDAAGGLTTALPRGGAGDLPRLRLADARLTLDRAGRPPLTLEHLDAVVEPDGSLSGRVRDPAWGEWAVGGRARLGDGLLDIDLDTPAADLTPGQLEAVPFIPASLWQQIRVAGRSVPLAVGLRFDFNKAPRVGYRVEFANAAVAVLQRDRAPFALNGASGTVEGDEAGLRLEGAVNDPAWGAWTVAAGLHSASGSVNLALAAADVAVTPEKLQSLPFVPKVVWEQVRATGRTAARVAVRFWTHQPGVAYRVDLAPRLEALGVGAIDLDVQGVTGAVRVEDGRVWLDGVRGRAAGGTIGADGELDFRDPASRLRFRVEVRDVALTKLPDGWKIPKQIDGLLTGNADLQLTVADGKTATRGEGRGRIDKAKLAGFATPGPIPLLLHADGRGFRFSPELPTGLRLDVFLVHLLFLAAPPVQAPPAYLETTLALTDVDLAELLRRLEVTPPVPVAGRLSFRVRAGIPVDTPGDARAYRLDGTATLKAFRVPGLELKQAEVTFSYRDGVLRVSRVTGLVVPGGSLAGSGTLQAVPPGDLDLALDFTDLPLSLFEAIQGDLGARGTASGRLAARVAAGRLQDPAAWRGSLRVVAAEVSLRGLTFRDVSGSASLAEGRVSVPDLAARWQGAPLTGSGAVSLAGEKPFTARVALADFDLAALDRLDPAYRPPVRLEGRAGATGDLRGTLSPWSLAVRGRAAAERVTVQGVPIEAVGLTWSLDRDAVRLRDVCARVFGGVLTGSARLPVRDEVTGEADLRLDGVELARVARLAGSLLTQLAGQLAGPVRLRGDLAGTLAVKIGAAAPGPASRVGPRRDVTAELDLQGGRLRAAQQAGLAGVAVNRLQGEVKLRGGRPSKLGYEYQVQADLAGGRVALTGAAPTTQLAGPGPLDSSWGGRLEVRGVNLARLARALQLDGALAGLGGVLYADVPFRLGPGGRPTGRGRVRLRDVRRGTTELADEVLADLEVAEDRVTLRDVGGTVAGGLLRASVGYRFAGRGWFTVNLTGADAARLAALVPDGERGWVEGSLDLHLRGSLGPAEWDGGGTLLLSRGKVLGVGVSEWRVPVRFTLVPSRGRAEVTVSDSTARAGTGRAQLRGSAWWGEGGGARLDGTVQVFDAQLKDVAALLGDVSSFAQGRLSGRVDFGGTNVRGLGDLTAGVQATFDDAQALQLPVLRQVTPFLLRGGNTVRFERGELRGRLAGGVLRVQHLDLMGPLLDLLMEGVVTTQGRLDLHVTARTSNLGLDPLAVRGLASAVPAIGPVPVPVIVQVSNLLTNRLIRLHVTGTVRNPVVAIEPIRLLTEEAVRFFITQGLRR